MNVSSVSEGIWYHLGLLAVDRPPPRQYVLLPRGLLNKDGEAISSGLTLATLTESSYPS